MFPIIDPKKKLSDLENEVLLFWKENGVFEKSVEQRKNSRIYSFYDGPPFITGVPHLGTLLPSVAKDCVPRYWTMKGYKVERRWGWDCHGLPAENMVEKKLGIKSKKEIEENIGIEKFNQACFETVSKIAADWENIIARIGRWVDFKGAYKTMDKTYMESVWWAFKQLYDKGLVYEDVRISLYCPHCATPLSNFEIAMDNSYEMDTDPSVYVKIKVKGKDNTYFLAWTTTPWTLPANVVLAVGENIEYVKIKNQKSKVKNNEENYKDEYCILAKNRIADIFGEQNVEIIETLKGSNLAGIEYEPIFPHNIQNGYKVIAADFVSADDGTGIVHIAPAFGEDDFNARKQKKLPIILNIDEEGKFIEGEWAGMNVWDANTKIVTWLKENGFLFKKENIKHSYPHCYRCHAKMIYKAQPAWFVAISKIKDKLLKENENINWFPEYLKEGRFKRGIESAPDWNISRDRYWGTPMPVWKCGGQETRNKKQETNVAGVGGGHESKKKNAQSKCNNIRIIGSYEELEELSGVKLDDYHRPKIDGIKLKCEKCGGEMKRIPQIFDCWLESGSMPFAQFHYPFENKEKFEKSFPADFICEYVPQTRAWFYLLHVIAVSIFDSEAFKNVIVTGTIAGNDGRKMSKSLGNYTDPSILIEKYTADALRFYFLASPLMSAQDVSLQDKDVDEIYRGMLMRLWNSFAFFNIYANVDKWEIKNHSPAGESKIKNQSLLDRWIISKLHELIRDVDRGMQEYDIAKAARKIPEFIDNLSNWYIRRSRRRFWKSEDDADKNSAYQTLYAVLLELSKIMAPFTPFISEMIYRNLTADYADGTNKNDNNIVSVHLQDYPVADKSLIDEKLNDQMNKVRKIVELGLAARAKAKIKVRQPLGQLLIEGVDDLPEELEELIKDEVNVKETKKQRNKETVGIGCANPPEKTDKIISLEDNGIKISLDINITEELQIEGIAREIVRMIQEARKDAGFEVSDRIEVLWSSEDELIQKAFESFRDYIMREVLAIDLSPFEKGGSPAFAKSFGEAKGDFTIDGREWKLEIKKLKN